MFLESNPTKKFTAFTFLGRRFNIFDFDFGAGQVIARSAEGYVAASDPRRDGQAAGF